MEALQLAYGGFARRWGNFDDPENVMGPVISKKQQERVLGYIDGRIYHSITNMSDIAEKKRSAACLRSTRAAR